MTRTETTTLDRLLTAVREAHGMLAALNRLLPEPEGTGPDTGTIGRHPPESKEPWAQKAAGAYWDLYFGARTVARRMRAAQNLGLRLFDDAYGADALKVIVNMAPGSPDDVLGQATRDLERWIAQAQSVPAIDETEPWTALPRAPGGIAVACPYCKTFALRMLRRKGEVRCFFPSCTDADGNPTRARMEPGRMTGEERLIFGDGTTMGGGV